MDTNARQIGQCLPADVLRRIAEYEAREARTSAALSGVSAGEGHRAFPAKGEEKPQTGKVIYLDTNMRAGNRNRTPRRGPARIFVFRQDRHG